MKHNKVRNVGIIFELLNKRVSKLVVERNTQEAQKLFRIVRKYFLSEGSYIKEVFDKIYSPVLYGETNNYYYAGKFLKYLIEEYSDCDQNKLNKEINEMLKDLDNTTNRKQLFESKLDNYKLFASIKCLGDNKIDKFKLTVKEKVDCEKTIMEHLIDNKEVKQIRESFNIVEVKDKEEIADENLMVTIALKKFREKYKSTLTEDQNQCLLKYLSSPDKTFDRWAEKKIKSLVESIGSTIDSIEDEKISEKLNLANRKYSKMLQERNINATNMKDILLSFDLSKHLDLF